MVTTGVVIGVVIGGVIGAVGVAVGASATAASFAAAWAAGQFFTPTTVKRATAATAAIPSMTRRGELAASRGAAQC